MVLEGIVEVCPRSSWLASLAILAMAVTVASAATFDELAAQAAAARRANHIPEALGFYRQAVQIQGSWEEGWWFLGTLSYASYQYTDCENAFDEFVNLDDKRALAWSLLGLCEFENGKYDPASEHLRHGLLAAKDLPPEVEAGVRFHYGLVLSQAGYFEQGKRQLERYARGGAHEPMLITGLGLNALRLPMLPKDVPSDRLDAVLKAGAATRAWILGQMDDAGAGFEELVAKYPELPGVHYLYGTFLSAIRPEQAMAEFRRELQANPNDAEANAMVALLLVHANDFESALPFAKKAAVQKASSPLVEFAYGEVLNGLGEMRPAIARLEAAIHLDSAMLEFHMALATAYSKAGRNDEARRERRLSLDIATGNLRPSGAAEAARAGAELGTAKAAGRTPENR